MDCKICHIEEEYEDLKAKNEYVCLMNNDKLLIKKYMPLQKIEYNYYHTADSTSNSASNTFVYTKDGIFSFIKGIKHSTIWIVNSKVETTGRKLGLDRIKKIILKDCNEDIRNLADGLYMKE